MEREESGSDIDDEPPINQQPGRRRRNEDAFSIINLLQSVYNNKFYWQITKSVIIFAVALKVARECKHIAIPMKDYEPFAYINVCTCR